MGLAPYGEPKYYDLILANLIDLKEDGTFKLDMSYFNYAVGLTMTSKKFNKLFNSEPRKPEEALTQHQMDIAASIQKVTEEVVIRLCKTIKKEFDVDPDKEAHDRFLSLEMIWPKNKLLRTYVLSPRLGQISADLLGVSAVRLYHDNVLAKQAGCGRTPWHFDDHHFPLDTNDVVTAWVPAQPTPIEMGPLSFAYPLDVHKLVNAVTFEKTGTGYDRGVSEVFKKNGVTVNETPFELGEVSFHHNLNFHTASRNRTSRSRVALANTYFRDGARVINNPTMVSGDWQKFMPNINPGEVAASPLNPICWPVDDK